jgi:hypothetical protein
MLLFPVFFYSLNLCKLENVYWPNVFTYFSHCYLLSEVAILSGGYAQTCRSNVRPPQTLLIQFMINIKLQCQLLSHFIRKNPTICNNVSKFYYSKLYEAQHVSGDTPPIIRSLRLHLQPLVFHTWKVVGRVVGSSWNLYVIRWSTPVSQKKFSYQTEHPLIRSLTTSTNYTSNNLPCTKNQRLPVQF